MSTRQEAIAAAGRVLGTYFASLTPEELAALEPPGAKPIRAERMYSVRAAAEMLSVGRHWVLARIKDGRIPAVDIGDRRVIYRISESALTSFLASREAHTMGR